MKSKNGVIVNRGCFNVNLKEFEIAVEKKHSDSKIAKEYQCLIDSIKVRFNISEYSS